jgi:multidrug resistance efflux pump
LNLALSELERSEMLLDLGLGPENDVVRNRATVEIQEHEVAALDAELRSLDETSDRDEALMASELAEAESNYTLAAAMPREEEIEQSQARLAVLERRKMLLDEELALAEIRAPISGKVVTQNMEQLRDRAVIPGEELARIVDYTMVRARLSVPEKDLADVAHGSRIVLKSRAHPLRNFEGKVDFIAPVADVVDDARFVDVETLLANHDEALRPGTTGVAKIYAGRRLVVQLIFRKMIQWVRTEFWDLIP